MVTAAARNSAAVFSCGKAKAAPSGHAGARGELVQSVAADEDDLARDVYCVLGLPIDAVELPEAVRRIDAAAADGTPFLISTVNVNFLVTSAVNTELRDSVVFSDLCPADGMPIVWIARLLGIPIKHRVAGSDIFDTLKGARGTARPLRLFLFGGAKGAASAAAAALSSKPGGLRSVGSIYPGYGSVDEMSRDAIIDAINASQADILIVALGAAKGQTWLLRNHHRLHPPIRSHLGAAVNFAAGTVKRSPLILRQLGLEWLWRIKEEPHLWRRYAHDGGVLLRLFATRVLPLAMAAQWRRLRIRKPQELQVNEAHDHSATTLSLSGDAIARYLPQAMSYFRRGLVGERLLKIDLSSIGHIDARFFGLFLMLRKRLNSETAGLKFIGITPRLARLFKLHGVEFLLSE
jgi:N-acetylglucosaminyldiphosphoundecaprenol N-acetyl-beta-D-mannosaminyltransferase